jgi:5'-methylthioadenosine phosphorylase
MTSATEARLCREAEICYAVMNLVTDYDVWHEAEGVVSVEMILENFRANIHNAKDIIKKAVALLSPQSAGKCDCESAVKNTIVTAEDLIPRETKEKLHYIIRKYIKI